MRNNVNKKKSARAVVLLISLIVLGISTAFIIQEKPKGKPWNAPEKEMKAKNPVKSDEAILKEGKDIYSQHCKSCHGVKGKGDGTKAEKLDISCGDFTADDVAKQTDGELYWKTTEGRKPMPSFKEKLSDTERWTVINYVRSLGKAK
ncbi:MAG: cytochrome c [Bacteroidia bacterium]|nr:cytochrome c [Bacteroidia bacterium]